MTTIYTDWGKVVIPRGVPHVSLLSWQRVNDFHGLRKGVVMVVDKDGVLWQGDSTPRQMSLWEAA